MSGSKKHLWIGECLYKLDHISAFNVTRGKPHIQVQIELSNGNVRYENDITIDTIEWLEEYFGANIPILSDELLRKLNAEKINELRSVK